MHFVAGEVYHIYNRGNNKQPIFFNDNNYIRFLAIIKHNWQPFCDILCWCLMPNHFHFMIQATEDSCNEINSYGNKTLQILSKKIGLSLSSYAQYINRQNKTSGSLFQQKTKAKCISDIHSERTGANKPHTSYIRECMHYIHQNPQKSHLVKRMEDWAYSSFQDYIGLRNGTLCNKKLLLELSGCDEARFCQDSYAVIDSLK